MFGVLVSAILSVPLLVPARMHAGMEHFLSGKQWHCMWVDRGRKGSVQCSAGTRRARCHGCSHLTSRSQSHAHWDWAARFEPSTAPLHVSPPLPVRRGGHVVAMLAHLAPALARLFCLALRPAHADLAALGPGQNIRCGCCGLRCLAPLHL